MDKLRYLISVFERLAEGSPAIAEQGARLKNGFATESEVDALYEVVSGIMESTAGNMTAKRAAAISSALSGLRTKERQERQAENASDVLTTIL